MEDLISEITNCKLCADSLPHLPRPVVQLDNRARLLIIGQAPGIRVQNSGIPWNDPSGNRLRNWLGVSDDIFYDASKVAIMPMGFCYPGKGRSGDLPPRPECAPHWHQKILNQLPAIRVTLLIGQFAQNYYLPIAVLNTYPTLAERIQFCTDLPEGTFLLPHPSPRNQIWLKKNPWFESDRVPALQKVIRELFD